MAHPRTFRFAIMLSRARGPEAWAELARKAEGLGYSTLMMADHFSDQFGIFPALTAAAGATTTLRVGSLVLGNDFRHPAVVAKDAATVDVLSGGRLEFGLGTGWAISDYEPIGMPLEAPGVRVNRWIESIQVIKGLWGADPCSFSGQHYNITDLNGTPKPTQQPNPPIIMGGGGKRVLTAAATYADIVSMNPNVGSGRFDAATAATMTASATDEKYRWVKDAAGDRLADLELSFLKFAFALTAPADRDATEEKVATGLGLTPAQVRESPYALVGSADQLAEELQSDRERWGVSYVVVQRDALDAFAPVVAKLAGT